MGVGILAKELSENVVEVRRKSNRIMAIVLTLGKGMIRIICAYGPQSRRPDTEKVDFYDEIVSEWDLASSSEIIVSLGDFNGHEGKSAEGFEGVHRKNGIGKRNPEGRKLLEFYDENEMSMANTWFYKTKEKSLRVLVDVKQNWTLCL